MLPTLHETFLAMNWAYRDRVTPLHMTTPEGLRTLAQHGLAPDLIYFDAEHTTEAVFDDLETASRLFPDAVLVGDDYDEPRVRAAVERFADRHGLSVETVGDEWRAWKLKRREERTPDPSQCFGLT